MERFAKIDKDTKLVLDIVSIDDEDILDKYLHKHYDHGSDVFWKKIGNNNESEYQAYVGDSYCEERSKFLPKDRYNLPSGYIFDEETCKIVCIIDKNPPEITQEQLENGFKLEWSDELMDWQIAK